MASRIDMLISSFWRLVDKSIYFVLDSAVGERLQKWGNSMVIVGFTIFEIFCSLGVCTLFFFVRALAKLAWGNLRWAHLLILTLLELLHGCVGTYAVFRRRVRSTRYYSWTLPVFFVINIIISYPLWRTTCDCDDYTQCKVLTEISMRDLVNVHNHPSKRHLKYAAPAPEKRLPEEQELKDESDEVEYDDDDDDDDEDAGKRKKLVAKSCTCKGSVESTRESCLKDPGVDNSEWWLYKHQWCEVRTRSVKQCRKTPGWSHYIVTDAKGVERPWTYDICEGVKCGCSGVPMKPPDDAELIKEEYRTIYGSECRRWLEDDMREWCFVGFDTTCADRRSKWYHVQVKKQMKDIREAFQFRSAIPCQDPEREHWTNACTFFVHSFRAMLVLINLLHLPMGLIILVFLNNHCGDHVDVEEQFDVHSSDDDDDEWTPKSWCKKDQDIRVLSQQRVRPSLGKSQGSGEIELEMASRGFQMEGRQVTT